MNIDEDVKFLKIQTCVLKVNIHCDGCKQKVKKLLQKIDGVYTTTVDSEQGKVTVSGNVDASTLIKKLGKSGKHAELWSSPKGGNKNSSNPLDMLLQKMGQKGQKDAKSEKGGKDQKGLPQLQLPEQLQQMKGFQDMKLPQFKNLQLPPKDQKSVKFKAVEDDLSDEYDDDDDDFDDEFDDEFDEEEEEMMKAQLLKDIKMKAMNGLQVPSAGNKNVQLPVKGDGGKKGGANPTPNLNQNQNSGGGGKGGAKNGGANDKNTPKGGGPPKEMGPMGPGLQKLDLSGFGVGAGQMGQMGHQMGQIPRQSMPPQGNIPAVHGLPMNAGGYFPPAGPEIMAGNPYHQQQLAAMMYARPPPDVAYALYTPPPQYHSSGPETDFFSEENTNSCSVM